MPQILAATDTSNEVKYHAVSDRVPRRTIVAATHSGRLPSFLARQFIALVRETYTHLINNMVL